MSRPAVDDGRRDDIRPARELEFTALVRAVADPVRRYLWRRTDETTAEDVLSETLLVLWRRPSDVPEDEPIPWAIGIARRQLQNAQRTRRREGLLTARILALDPPDEHVDPMASTADTDDSVRRVLDTLRPDDAELLRLWIWEELEPRHIAAVLGISANAAAIRLHRARRRFAEAFGKDVDRPGHIEMNTGGGR